MNLHKQKIKEIQYSKKPKNKDNSLDHINMSKLRTHEFAMSEKEAAIRRGNEKLLDKLVEISSGKHVLILLKIPFY